ERAHLELSVECLVEWDPDVVGDARPGHDHGVPAELRQVAGELHRALDAGAAERREMPRDEQDALHACTSAGSSVRTTRAGAPTATERAGTSESTTEFAPIT